MSALKGVDCNLNVFSVLLTQISELMKGKLIPGPVIKLLWEKFTMKVKPPLDLVFKARALIGLLCRY